MPINRAFQRLKKPRKDGFLEKLKNRKDKNYESKIFARCINRRWKI